ncbi:bile acid:sodium symporter family protein [Liquorilactobacillus hordei]|uniref:Sodium-dependent transporter n=1 Tax=Liquorilactobacillus hordei DSM 19519 TaxID=1423759 RepID=A0A0R1MLJ6_9LACO|nr:bile acid:sodium symporter family protein [Liquorilactobacillus hordei]KRL08345.1 sodium-dependent transporter [Liquorilactobacillus hordei DSM 19519]QYH52558.1 bile acid:sodium symporter family protein [Liquorilactobacillus hordei DSM 19519]
MNKVEKISKLVGKYFTAAIIFWVVFNYFLPKTSEWVVPNVSYLLGIIFFGMGLTLKLQDFERIAKKPFPVIAGTFAHYLIMPTIAWILCLIFQLKGATAAGVILVGSCPSGTSSSVMAYLAGGDVALDVSIETLSTLLAPIALPGLLLLFAGKYVDIPTFSLFLSTVKIVLVPILLGLLVHHLFKNRIEWVTRFLPLVSQLAILLIIGAVISANHADLMTTQTLLVIPVVMLHNLSGYGLGYVFSKLIRLRTPQRKAITFEVGMQDSSLGATLAMKYFVPAAAIPSTVFSIWHNISGSVLAVNWKNKTVNEKTKVIREDTKSIVD